MPKDGKAGTPTSEADKPKNPGKGRVAVHEEFSSPPTYAQLMELYKIAVDEYRFQVNLNAQRARDYFVLNSAIIASAAALLGQKNNLLAGLVFVAGLIVAALTGFGFHTQHNYYRESRAAKRALELRLGIRDAVVKTTPSAGSRRWRLGSVTRFNYLIISLLCLVNLLGAVYSFEVVRLPAKKVVQPESRSRKSVSPPRSRVQTSTPTAAKPGKLPTPAKPP